MQFDLFNAPPRFETLEELVKALAALEDDPLAVHGTNIVVYRGNPAARLMIVGEAPGAEEDRLGKPFVGRSGQLLDDILRAAGFDPERDVFITNSAFRRPPENRNPTPEEIEYYRPWLLEIVRLIDPPLVLLAGGVAAQTVLGETRGITKIRGEWFDWYGRAAMPIFHPAYLLRNQSRTPGSPKALMWQDIQEVRRRWEALNGAARTPGMG